MPDATPPITATIEEAIRLTGLTKTDLYGLLRAGTIKAKKRGRITLIVMDTLRQHLDSLPDATFGVGGAGGVRLRQSKRAA